MKLDKRIYCIEGHWNYGKREAEPSVEPMLKLLSDMGEWDYARRDCATREEMEYWIHHEWSRCRQGSILYVASHGSRGEIALSEDHSLSLWDVAEVVGSCEGCMVHFGGCKVLSRREDDVREFMERTGAVVVSGYRNIVGWTNAKWRPAVALELLLFSSVWQYNLSDGRSVRGLVGSVGEMLRTRFDDCKFEIYSSWD